ncbi:hypothetical protein ID866_11422 [Astraeus odoratus]|nr:hypothetical protein ID866_11422 [Astraeus odoratus]
MSTNIWSCPQMVGIPI